jgi:hypothetical protein
MTTAKGRFGADGPLFSNSAPGESSWTKNVWPPSASRRNRGSIGKFKQSPSSGFATSRLDGSASIVSDQNACASGSSSGAKRMRPLSTGGKR